MKISFLLKMPHNSYVGGIAFTINQYLQNKFCFIKEEIVINCIDRNIQDGKYQFGKKISNIASTFKSVKYIKKKINEENISIIHIHSSRKWTLLQDMFIARKIRKNFSGKLILSIHFAEKKKILYKNWFLQNYVLKTMHQVFDKIIFLSKATQTEFINSGIKATSTELLYTFHNFNYQMPILKKTIPINLLFVGSIDKRKGIIDLLHSLKSINKDNYHLHICGSLCDQSIKEEFETLFKELKDNITFHGYVSGNKKEKIFEEADIFVLPSYSEGMPIVIMEAMAAGCAIISTTVGAIPEIISKENGILIEPGNTSLLTSSIIHLIENKELLNEIKQKNYEISKKYNLENHIQKLCHIYKEIA